MISDIYIASYWDVTTPLRADEIEELVISKLEILFLFS